MAQVYVLTFLKATANHVVGEKHCFTTLVALFEYFEYHEIKVSYSYVARHSFKTKAFKTKNILIEKLPLLNKTEASRIKRRNKESSGDCE